MTKTILSAIAAAATLALAVPASAQAPRSQTVEFNDLDIATPAGAAELDRRLRQAISRVCRASSVLTIRQNQAVRECKEELRIVTQNTVAALRTNTQRRATAIALRSVE